MNSFDDFWAAYPRRVAKFHARTAWDKALKLATAEEIIAGAKKYAALVAGKEKQYIAHPATWLRGGRWLDEDETPSVKPQFDSVNEFLARWEHNARKQAN